MSTAERQPTAISSAPQRLADEEAALVVALRRGDEAAFTLLIERYHLPLVRLAQTYVTSRAVAEEVAQETWLGVIQGIDRFAERSSLKTWIYTILTNRARTRGVREGRSVPFADLTRRSGDADELLIDPDEFYPQGHAEAGWWARHPQSWSTVPEERLLGRETRAQIDAAIEVLPASQRAVIVLRDVEGLSCDEVCHALGISEGNQRVLLHRARTKVRSRLDAYLMEG